MISAHIKPLSGLNLQTLGRGLGWKKYSDRLLPQPSFNFRGLPCQLQFSNFGILHPPHPQCFQSSAIPQVADALELWDQ